MSTITPLIPTRQEAPPQAVRLVHVLLEAMAGRRALHQVRPLLVSSAFTRLAEYADTGRFRRIAVGPVRSQMPARHVVEATVSIRCGARVIGCAIRLEAREGRWQCTEWTVLQPAALTGAAA